MRHLYVKEKGERAGPKSDKVAAFAGTGTNGRDRGLRLVYYIKMER